ncbi:Transcriptional regulatory moc3 [Fusarium albosuccineum]|uniref:Transcriptional regulatory moc3 n=1 Tax=Fusarium albosuccineum TaxID=1237068 RepID=A0A8H4L0N9_9HYPO|nr:Transcriptional regulatory moc3 [Fusarium albosuccineum]
MPTLSPPISISTLLDDQQDIRACLESWLHFYHASRDRMASKADDQLQISLAGRLLLVYHSMACIMTETCIAPTNDSVFDYYSPEFASIVDQCMDLWRSAAQMMAEDISSGHCTHRFSFSADMGFILPLYYTGLKCRVPETRRAALALLLSAPHQEGVWNGRLAARVIRRVIEIEERDHDSDSETGNNLPEFNRIHDVRIELSDCSTTKAVLSYKIRQANGPLVTRQEDIAWD